MEAKSKVLLFSVTRDDCDWEFFPAGGPGGQNSNKTCTACRCTHRASGATAVARELRSQPKNRELAFGRMARTSEFQKWLRIETARKMGESYADEERQKKRSSDEEARIRTYNFSKQFVKDHRTETTVHDTQKVMDGHIDPFIEAMILKQAMEG